MSKKEFVRNYDLQPRRYGEMDNNYRGDLEHFEPTLTKQSEKEACDINNIMARYQQTGVLPDMIRQDPQYGDFSDIGSFMEAQNIVAHANAQFAALDAHVRARFNNNPAEMLKFVEQAANDPEKGSELVKLGLAIPREMPSVEEATPKKPEKADSGVSS